MAFEHYTRCIQPSQYIPRSFGRMTVQALALSAPFAVLALGKPLCLLILAEIFALIMIILWARNWLYERLICLGDDQDVIGVIAEITEPRTGLDFSDEWDNDYRIDLVLQNTEFGVSQDVAQVSEPYGYLIHPQPAITNPPVGRDTPGHFGTDKKPPGTGKVSWGLHCEFEGAGVYNLLQVSQGMLGFAVAALLACVFLPFPADMVVAIGLAALAFLGWIIGAILSNNARPGSPSDANPDLGTLHTNTEENDGLGKGADVVYVQGTWVYDSLHEGWNEIHPVKICTIVGPPGGWDGDWSTQPTDDVILRIREAFRVAQAEETLANQALPEHQWRLHPDLDGCARDVIL